MKRMLMLTENSGQSPSGGRKHSRNLEAARLPVAQPGSSLEARHPGSSASHVLQESVAHLAPAIGGMRGQGIGVSAPEDSHRSQEGAPESAEATNQGSSSGVQVGRHGSWPSHLCACVLLQLCIVGHVSKGHNDAGLQ